MTKAKVLAIGKYIIAANWNTPGECTLRSAGIQCAHDHPTSFPRRRSAAHQQPNVYAALPLH
ncbi:MAG: hypothetical protein J7601_10365, partial [Chloroflexi bacterium]|nr:hypothetical protein [Chloroflexota bacterium]